MSKRHMYPILGISDTVIMVRKHVAAVHNVLFEIAWLKYFRYCDKWQTRAVKFNHDQYLKSVIIPSNYHLILFSSFIFVEVIFGFVSGCFLFKCLVTSSP